MTDRARKSGCRLSRSRRIAASRQFETVYARGCRFVGRIMVMWCYPTGCKGARLGVVASRRVGSAVERNRAKRRLREAFRLNTLRHMGGFDVVLVARKSIVKADWRNIVAELNKLAGLAGIGPNPGQAQT